MGSTVVTDLTRSSSLQDIQLKTGNIDAQIVSSMTSEKKRSVTSYDEVDVQMNDLYKNLTVLADKVIAKLDEALAEELPDGIRSLNPEDHTAEQTAKRIVDGTTAFFGLYAQQNPDLEGEELVDSFMKEIRRGIKNGYEDAKGLLEAIGALKFDNVESGIEETMSLVEEGLKSFEDRMKESFKPKETEAPAEQKPDTPEQELQKSA